MPGLIDSFFKSKLLDCSKQNKMKICGTRSCRVIHPSRTPTRFILNDILWMDVHMVYIVGQYYHRQCYSINILSSISRNTRNLPLHIVHNLFESHTSMKYVVQPQNFINHATYTHIRYSFGHTKFIYKFYDVSRKHQ